MIVLKYGISKPILPIELPPFSAYGNMRQMSNSPVANVVIEALSEQCEQHQSESVTDSDGFFRLRGLKPGCSYRLYPKGIFFRPIKINLSSYKIEWISNIECFICIVRKSCNDLCPNRVVENSNLC